ncbi:OTU deubiquitinase with linear linkage specificity a [Pempheris klunzingeri]|uniref:OTU deubiquitinase with linear linkage specificity a n=1 Tax=Pempheris klunzingeri TaxID=3127111 RepID=UPI00397E9E37
MSWFKAVSYSGEDVFDENADDMNFLNKEWTSNMKKRIRDGYVDGIDAGEEAALQAGFNLGFREGGAQIAAFGRLKGIVSAVWCWYQIQHPESPIPASMTDLLQRVSERENSIVEGLRRAVENPPPSVSSVSESMEDLKVEPADSGCCGEGCKETNCCKRGEQMDMDTSHGQQRPCSVSADDSSSSGESLNDLLQRCVDLVSELGLPQELIGHIQELRSM